MATLELRNWETGFPKVWFGLVEMRGHTALCNAHHSREALGDCAMQTVQFPIHHGGRPHHPGLSTWLPPCPPSLPRLLLEGGNQVMMGSRINVEQYREGQQV